MPLMPSIDVAYGLSKARKCRAPIASGRRHRTPVAAQVVSNNPVGDAAGILSLVHHAQVNALEMDALLVKLEEPLVAFVRRRITNTVRALEDTPSIAHDALIRIASRIKKCRATSDRQFMAWALAITRNVIADYWRSERLKFETLDMQVMVSCAEAFTQWATDIDSPALPEEQSAHAELQAIVCKVYDTLPADMAQLCWEHIVYGATWAESGSTLGVSADAAKHRYLRAIKAIRGATLRRIRALSEPMRSRVVERLAECGWAVD